MIKWCNAWLDGMSEGQFDLLITICRWTVIYQFIGLLNGLLVA